MRSIMRFIKCGSGSQPPTKNKAAGCRFYYGANIFSRKHPKINRKMRRSDFQSLYVGQSGWKPLLLFDGG